LKEHYEKVFKDQNIDQDLKANIEEYIKFISVKGSKDYFKKSFNENKLSQEKVFYDITLKYLSVYNFLFKTKSLFNVYCDINTNFSKIEKSIKNLNSEELKYLGVQDKRPKLLRNKNFGELPNIKKLIKVKLKDQKAKQNISKIKDQRDKTNKKIANEFLDKFSEFIYKNNDKKQMFTIKKEDFERFKKYKEDFNKESIEKFQKSFISYIDKKLADINVLRREQFIDSSTFEAYKKGVIEHIFVTIQSDKIQTKIKSRFDKLCNKIENKIKDNYFNNVIKKINIFKQLISPNFNVRNMEIIEEFYNRIAKKHNEYINVYVEIENFVESLITKAIELGDEDTQLYIVRRENLKIDLLKLKADMSFTFSAFKSLELKNKTIEDAYRAVKKDFIKKVKKGKIDYSEVQGGYKSKDLVKYENWKNFGISDVDCNFIDIIDYPEKSKDIQTVKESDEYVKLKKLHTEYQNIAKNIPKTKKNLLKLKNDITLKKNELDSLKKPSPKRLDTKEYSTIKGQLRALKSIDNIEFDSKSIKDRTKELQKLQKEIDENNKKTKETQKQIDQDNSRNVDEILNKYGIDIEVESKPEEKPESKAKEKEEEAEKEEEDIINISKEFQFNGFTIRFTDPNISSK
jgi:hypothetical protein